MACSGVSEGRGQWPQATTCRPFGGGATRGGLRSRGTIARGGALRLGCASRQIHPPGQHISQILGCPAPGAADNQRLLAHSGGASQGGRSFGHGCRGPLSPLACPNPTPTSRASCLTLIRPRPPSRLSTSLPSGQMRSTWSISELRWGHQSLPLHRKWSMRAGSTQVLALNRNGECRPLLHPLAAGEEGGGERPRGCGNARGKITMSMAS